MTIYHELVQLGFKVWCSQFMTAQGIQVDEDGMRCASAFVCDAHSSLKLSVLVYLSLPASPHVCVDCIN